MMLSSWTWASLITSFQVLSCSSKLHFFSQAYIEQIELLVKLILCTIYLWLFSVKLLKLPLKLRIISFTVSNYRVSFLLFSSKTRVWAHNMLGGLSRRNYCENGPVQDSNQHLLYPLLTFFFVLQGFTALAKYTLNK